MITKEDYLLEKVRKLPPQLILQKVRDAFDKEILQGFSIIRDSSILHCIEDLIAASVIEATIEEDVKVPKHWSALMNNDFPDWAYNTLTVMAIVCALVLFYAMLLKM